MSMLYIVGTPIGNLGDMSPRAVEVLGDVHFIAAEDTRVTRKLLNHFSIDTPMISYHQHNLQQASQEVVRRIMGGERCALVTDAGMPAISDPGEELVALCAVHGIEVVVVPGPSAVTAALAVSGLPTQRFSFEGFVSITPRKRQEHLASLATDPRTLVFYEAPHKLIDTLQDLLEVLGDRNISLCRELTKLHEEVRRTTLSQAVTHYETHTPRGEYVLIVEGASAEEEEPLTLEEAIDMVVTLHKEQDFSLSQAAREIAGLTSYKRGELYKGALDSLGE